LAIIFTILGAMQIRNFPLFVFSTFIPFTYSVTSLIYLCFKNSPPPLPLLNEGKERNYFLSLGRGLRRGGKGWIFLLLLFEIMWRGYIFIGKRVFGWNVPEGLKS